jgi:hypothetical protein
LIGRLNFASRVVVPGRSFVLYLIYFSTHVKELHHYLTLNKECRVDLQFWLTFLHVTGPTVLCAAIGILSLLNIIVIIAIVLSAIAFGGSTVKKSSSKCRMFLIKTVGPVTCLEYLGIVLDTVKFEARLPMDKVNRICEFIRNVLGKRSCHSFMCGDRYIKFVEYHRHNSHSSFCYRVWGINCQKVIKQM